MDDTLRFPADEREMKRRYIFISQMFEKMGLPIYDGEIGEMIQKLPYFKRRKSIKYKKCAS